MSVDFQLDGVDLPEMWRNLRCFSWRTAVSEMWMENQALTEAGIPKLRQKIRETIENFDVVGFFDNHEVAYDEWLKTTIFNLLEELIPHVNKNVDVLVDPFKKLLDTIPLDYQKIKDGYWEFYVLGTRTQWIDWISKLEQFLEALR